MRQARGHRKRVGLAALGPPYGEISWNHARPFRNRKTEFLLPPSSFLVHHFSMSVPEALFDWHRMHAAEHSAPAVVDPRRRLRIGLAAFLVLLLLVFARAVALEITPALRIQHRTDPHATPSRCNIHSGL